MIPEKERIKITEKLGEFPVSLDRWVGWAMLAGDSLIMTEKNNEPFKLSVYDISTPSAVAKRAPLSSVNDFYSSLASVQGNSILSLSQNAKTLSLYQWENNQFSFKKAFTPIAHNFYTETGTYTYISGFSLIGDFIKMRFNNQGHSSPNHTELYKWDSQTGIDTSNYIPIDNISSWANVSHAYIYDSTIVLSGTDDPSRGGYHYEFLSTLSKFNNKWNSSIEYSSYHDPFVYPEKIVVLDTGLNCRVPN